ncbi:actin-like ATPase domain-containing protein [Suhomyces tanzawaensis NRRL Y-17324]|uniref:Actin-like ATPase domain-containing protein n=1 Tax=Suhomyces tanzawaensis NRRL Y-17324 TaxID=984487 RepID=A0A1E4SKE5_9ASCO|nr:actin-like ATPase domain-containing protein [Suhomyces tanzawaensis NRRL Y-17324]ODV79974.1 actin-like ATPase domain-containing protein [Suhomyces tanzawaensis NRRL Y-17324]
MAPSKIKQEEAALPPQEVYYLKETPTPLTPEPFYTNYHQGVPIALDIGASSFKVGLTNANEPNNVFPSVLARYRYRKKPVTVTIVGNDVYRDPLLKTSIKSPFDGPLLTNWDYVESMLDYTFEHLGVTSNNGKLNNPIIMTEPVGCPLSQRTNMYELLFEAYQAPKVTFGIDSLFAFHANSKPNSDGLVIGTGHELTHVIPVVGGKGILLQTKRIDWGGNLSQQFLARLLGMKYPYFPSKITSDHTTNMFKDFCYILENYSDQLKGFLDMPNLEQNDVVIQAPVDLSLHTVKKKSEEELAKQLQRKKEQGRRLQEQQQQKRLEKKIQKQEELDYYSKLRDEIATISKQEQLDRVVDEGFEDLGEFNKYVKNLEKTLKSKDDDEDEGPVDPATAWPLVDIPDDQLNDEQIKEKRKQKLLKGNYDARERNKEIQRQEEEAKLQREKEEIEWRERDLEDWSNSKRLKVAELIGKHTEKVKLLESFKDRKSMAAQQRMKNITDLANDQSVGASGNASNRKRRRAAASIDNDPTDTFGANDDDWGVYREITNSSLEEDLDQISKQIVAIEEDLLNYDPSFHHEDTFSASQTFDWQNLVLHKFVHGPRPNLNLALQTEGIPAEEIANHPEIILKNHQMHLNIERIRVPEVLFQPHTAGLDQAGIIELLSDLLWKRLDGNFNPGGQAYNLIQNILITGGLANLKNFDKRVQTELTGVLPVGAPLKVRTAKNPITDAWKGMQKWSQDEESKHSYVSKAEYEEYGPEYIKEHGLGNVCLR